MINSFFRRYGLLIIFFIVFSIVAISSFNYVQKPKKNLPIYSPSMISDELVDEDMRYIKKYHRINDFLLFNQNGDTVTQNNYKNKIYVADFFFTTCPGICPIMKENMVFLQEEFKDDDNLLLLSHSVTPEIDSVPVLKKYSEEKGVIDSKWNMVTGDKKQIYNLARKSYLVAEDIESSSAFDMIHTENFVLVDTQRRIRGFYDGTNNDSMEELINDIKILKKEEFK